MPVTKAPRSQPMKRATSAYFMLLACQRNPIDYRTHRARFARSHSSTCTLGIDYLGLFNMSLYIPKAHVVVCLNENINIKLQYTCISLYRRCDFIWGVGLVLLNDFIYCQRWLFVFAFTITKLKSAMLQKTRYPNDDTHVRGGKNQRDMPLIWLQLLLSSLMQFINYATKLLNC